MPENWDLAGAWTRLQTLWGGAAMVAVVFALCLVVGLVVGRVLRAVLRHFAGSTGRRSQPLAAVTLEALARSATAASLAVGLRVAVGYYLFTEDLARRDFADVASKVVLLCAFGYIAYCLVDAVDAWLKQLAAVTSSKLDDMLLPVVRTTLRGVIVVFLLLYLTELVAGQPVGTVLAGLGIGGIAVGLAAQDTVKNFLGSLVLFADRPFELGDRIVFDKYEGTVERVGFRSTLIRTAEGHVVSIPNGELANRPITNMRKGNDE